MYTYELLEKGCHYLIKENENSKVSLIKAAIETDHCVFIQKFIDPTETEWKLKNDSIYDILECLTDEQIKEWEMHYQSNEDAYTEEEDDDD
jgi:hypothetical protein